MATAAILPVYAAPNMVIETEVAVGITVSGRSPGIAQTIAIVANPTGFIPPVYPFFTAAAT